MRRRSCFARHLAGATLLVVGAGAVALLVREPATRRQSEGNASGGNEKVLTAGDGEDTSTSGARISGRVVRVEDGEPVAGSVVVLDDISTARESDATVRVDADGRFELKGLSAGTYALTAHHGRLVAVESPAKLPLEAGEEMPDRTIRLGPGLDVRGTVRDSWTGEPIAGAEVVFRIPPDAGSGLYPDDRRGAVTGPDGAYRVTGLFAGPHDVEVGARGYLCDRLDAMPARSLGAHFDLTLQPGGTIFGRVLDPSGEPVVGASIELDPERLSADARSLVRTTETRTDATGTYRLDGLAPLGAYALIVRHDEYALGYVEDIELHLVPGQTETRVDVTLPRARSLRGRVRDAEGRPLAGAIVRARVETCGIDTILPVARILGDSEHRETTSGADGGYEFHGLRGRCYEVSAGLDGHRPAERGLTGRPDGGFSAFTGRPYPDAVAPIETLDLWLLPSKTVRGRVIDSEGRPCPGWQVFATSEAESSTGQDGHFTLRGFLDLAGAIWVENPDLDVCRAETFTLDRDPEDATFVVQAPARIRGTIRGMEGSDASDAELLLRTADGSWRVGLPSPDPDGRFELSLSPGTYELQAERAGLAPSRPLTVVLGSGEDRSGLELSLHAPATIQGTVYGATGRPLPDASVSFWLSGRPGHSVPSTKTGPDGEFVLEGLPPGPFALEVWGSGGPAAVTRIEGGERLRAGETRGVRVETCPVSPPISRRPPANFARGGKATIAGRALQGGETWPGRTRSLGVGLARRGLVFRLTKVDAEGKFEFDDLRPGRYVLFAAARSTHRGFVAVHEETVRIGGPGVHELDLELPARTLVHGRIGCNGEPVAEALLWVLGLWPHDDLSAFGSRPFFENTALTTAKTGGDGRYEIDLPRGRQWGAWLRTADGAGLVKLDIDLSDAGERHELDHALPVGGVEGRVVLRGTDVPVTGIRVEIFRRDAPLRSFESVREARRGVGWSDPAGRFEVPHLAPGPYAVRVEGSVFSGLEDAPGWLPPIVVGEGATREARLEVTPCIRPPRILVDTADGSCVDGLGVLVRNRIGDLVVDPFPLSTLNNTSLLLPRLPAGEYEVTVLHLLRTPARCRFVVGTGQKPQRLALERGATLELSVRDGEGDGVAGAEVSLRDEDGREVFDDRAPVHAVYGHTDVWGPARLTAQDGSFSIHTLRPGVYRASASRDGARTGEVEVTVDRDEVARATLVFHAPGG